MKPVIFLLLICISSIISKTIHKKPLHFCIESEPLTQHSEKQVADGSDDKEDIQPSGYEAIYTTLEPVVDIAENEKDSQNTSLLHQVDDIDDITIGSNDTDINDQSNESDINKSSSESDINTDINEEGNVTDVNNESNDTGINNESNDNSTTQANPTVIGIGIDPETEKSHVYDDSNANTENINNTSTETVNNGVNTTEKSADETNDGLNDEVQDNTDITNIRKVRAHLLDHLLEYFMNIIKQDKQYTQTRKKYSKDNMKLEDKLRNYYNPVHLDEFLNNNSEEIDLEEYSNSRRDAEGTNEDIVENKADPVTTSNINIEPLKLINITTDEIPVNESCVINESILNDNLNNKTETADLNLQNENEQDDKTSNGKLLLKTEENADILPNGVAIGDNIEREYSSTAKIYTNDVVTETELQNNENNIKSIKEIDARRKNINSDENKSNNLKENSTQQNTEDKNANNIALDHRLAKKSIMVKIIDPLKIKRLKQMEGETEHLLNQKNTVPRPYNLILQFNIHI